MLRGSECEEKSRVLRNLVKKALETLIINQIRQCGTPKCATLPYLVDLQAVESTFN